MGLSFPRQRQFGGLMGRWNPAQRGTASGPSLGESLRLSGSPAGAREAIMAQSLAKVYIHLILSTKNRERTLREDIRPDFHANIGGILRDLDSPCLEINRS